MQKYSTNVSVLYLERSKIAHFSCIDDGVVCSPLVTIEGVKQHLLEINIFKSAS